jgi:endonuclease/exonuclease/phosphatase family metal-dependent hydrolase
MDDPVRQTTAPPARFVEGSAGLPEHKLNQKVLRFVRTLHLWRDTQLRFLRSLIDQNLKSARRTQRDSTLVQALKHVMGRETNSIGDVFGYGVRRVPTWESVLRSASLGQLLAAVFLWLAVAGSSLGGDTIRVTTCNLEWFPSGKPTKAAPEVEAQKIADTAAAIEVLNPDVLLLQEVRDWETCERLATAVKSLKYQVAVCSAFKEFGSASWQQVAILSKRPAEAAWSEEWKTRGAVDPPRGFAFANFRFGSSLVGFYSVHLKSNLIRGGDHLKQTQLNILKRELAAEQLVAHAAGVGKAFAGMKSFVVGGDFNTTTDQQEFASERTLPLFTAAGFLNSFGKLPSAKRITHPGKGRYPDATFDYLFLKGLQPLGAPEITRSNLSDHWPVTVEASVP